MTETTRKRVLIFDDEQMIGDIACQMLDFYECDGVHKTTAIETVETYKASMSEGNPFDAVIVDLNVPGDAGGEVVVKDLLALDSDARVYVSSGSLNDSAMVNPSAFGFAGKLCKPFDLQAVENFVKELR